MCDSEEAILRAAGAVVAAVDGLYADPDPSHRLISAFCAVRPPGHHAERLDATIEEAISTCIVCFYYPSCRSNVSMVISKFLLPFHIPINDD